MPDLSPIYALISMEKILADISFDAPEMPGAQVVVNKAYVEEHLQDVRDDQDLSQYIL